MKNIKQKKYTFILVFYLLFILVINTNLIAQTERLKWINFSPYTDSGQNPEDLNSPIPTSQQINRLLDSLVPWVEGIRTFGTLAPLDSIPYFAKQKGLKVIVGIWLDNEDSAAGKAANIAQINKGISIANAGYADKIIVGSEVLRRGDMSPDTLIKYIQQIKSACPTIPVSCAEIYGLLIANPGVINVCDFVSPNIYPFWEGVPIECAMQRFHRAYLSLLPFVNGKEIFISESGWKTFGNSEGDAVPSLSNAIRYNRGLLGWSHTFGVDVNIFSAFDEPWKQEKNDDGWGIFFNNAVLKPGMDTLFKPFTNIDSVWLCSKMNNPGNDTLYVDYMPSIGSNDLIKGHVANIIPCDYSIATYIKVGEQWWTKPTFAKPTVEILCNGKWTVNYATQAGDLQATDICVFLVPSAYLPPSCGGGRCSIIPPEVYQNAIDWKCIQRTTISATLTASHDTICFGDSVTLTASGGTRYLWNTGNTTASIKVAPHNNTNYTVEISISSGVSSILSKTITVIPVPQATIVAGGPLTFCSGKSVILRTNTGTGYTYQWKKGVATIQGATQSSYSATAPGIYSVIVTNASGCSTTSTAINVIVNPAPPATVVASGPLTFCSGKSVILRTSTGTGFSYQWKRGAANIEGATQSSYTAFATGIYSVVVTNATGCSISSAGTNVVVSPLPFATITPIGPLTFCSGKNVLLKANTGTGYTYQWKRGGVNIPGQTSLYYTATTTGLYNVVVINAAGCAVTSAAVTVVENPLPVATITPGGPLAFCTGKNVLLRANTGTGYTYQWKKAGLLIPGGTAFTYTATTTGVYTVVVTNASGCSVTSAAVTVTVNPLPLATMVAASATTFCAGKDVLLKAIIGAGYSYQWKKNGASLTGETNSTYKANATGVYAVVVTNASGCSTTSTAINVTVNAAPLATVAIGGPTTFCTGKNVLLRAIVGNGYMYQWRKDGVNLHGQNSSNLTATAPGLYTVVVTNAQGCSTTSVGIPVTVNPAPVAIITPNGPLTFPQGGNVILKASAGIGYTYQWKKDGIILTGFTSDTYTATVSGSYTVDITNSNVCKTTSLPVQVSVTSGKLITKGLDSEDDLIKVYPNPLYRSEYLNIEWSPINADNGLVVTVSDITGRLIETRKLNQYDRKIRIKGASGIYIVEVRWGINSRKIFRVIKFE